jgi:hypothetical protein
MDPITTLAATGRLRSFWLIREMTSVLIPGLALVAEILSFLSERASLSADFTRAVDSGTARAALLVLGIAASWLVGYAAREASFRLLHWMTESSPLTGSALEEGEAEISASSWRRASSFTGVSNKIRMAPDSPSRMQHDLKSKFGSSQVELFLAAHPALLSLFKNERKGESPSRGGGSHYHDPSTAIFDYCKRWLRRNSPLTGVDETEIEINIMAGAVWPILLLTFAVASLTENRSPWTIPITAIASLVIFVVVAHSFQRLRRSERRDALHRTFEDWAMTRVEARTPTRQALPNTGS